jgi:tetratricopeptide (TPR) repeat protein
MSQETFGYNEIQIEILITLGNINSEIKEYDKAIELYESCLEYFNKLPRITNPSIEIRILYNLSLTFSKIEKDDLSIDPCIKGIQLCKKEKDLYLLGELYYQLGYSLWKIERNKEAIKNLETAIQIFRLLDMDSYIKHTQEIIEEVTFIKKEPTKKDND